MALRCRRTLHGWPALTKRAHLFISLIGSLLLLSPTAPTSAYGQNSGADSTTRPVKAGAQKTIPQGVLTKDIASTLIPGTVFFAGQVAPVQARNTGGAKLPDGLVLVGIVDTSGYSSSVQERYQAYLLLDTPVRFGGKQLEPGAYGCGVVNGEFLVLDLSAKLLFSVPVQRDADLKRPTPLQVIADSGAGSFRLYLGRNYVSFTPAGSSTGR